MDSQNTYPNRTKTDITENKLYVTYTTLVIHNACG